MPRTDNDSWEITQSVGSTALGVAAVDVGVPQLAMHSIRETAGSLDGLYLLHALAAFLAAPDEAIRCPASMP